MTTYIGIDPGLRGAVAILYEEHYIGVHGEKVRVFPTVTVGKEYDERWMWDVFDDVPVCDAVAYIEGVQAFPGQGRSSAVKIGLGQGLWRMALTGNDISKTIVSPRKWQRVMFAGVPKQDTKKMSIIAAYRLFPGVSLLRTPKCRKPDHNMADAVLIAAYGKRQVKQ